MLLFCSATNSQTLLILGDSLSAGYNMPVEQSWPTLLGDQLKILDKPTTIVNASISGDTSDNDAAAGRAGIEAAGLVAEI